MRILKERRVKAIKCEDLRSGSNRVMLAVMKLATVSLLLSLSFNLNADADVALPYSPLTDALCFKNADPELSQVGVPILGSLGVKQGICQGMAGVTAAFLENAQFEPEVQSTTSDAEVRSLIQKLVSLHQHVSREAVVINGSKNISDFCVKNKKEIMRASIFYNAEIATHEILPLLPEFYAVEKENLRGPQDQLRLQSELQSIEDTLKSGQYPQMLYFKHVVMVTEYKEVMSASGREIHLSVYDSNHPEQIVEHVFSLEMTGLPNLANYMVWDITPRLTKSEVLR
jgi:hypothetical protein